MERDTELLALVGPQGKSLVCLSEISCNVATKSGLTELSLVDHILTPVLMEDIAFFVLLPLKFGALLHNFYITTICLLLQDGSGTPKPFRYNIALKGKGNAVHCFEPKPLTEAVNVMQLRPSMFGAIFTGKLAKFPKSDMAQLVWEAILGFSVMIVFRFFCDLTGDIGAQRHPCSEAKVLAHLSNFHSCRICSEACLKA